MKGRVISNKMTKSAVILVSSKKTHPLYKKTFLATKKYLVDDPIGVKVGDIVEVFKVKPISKLKHFRISKVLGMDIVALGTETLKAEAKKVIEEVLPVEKEEVQKDSENSDNQKVNKSEKSEIPEFSEELSRAEFSEKKSQKIIKSKGKKK